MKRYLIQRGRFHNPHQRIQKFILKFHGILNFPREEFITRFICRIWCYNYCSRRANHVYARALGVYLRGIVGI